MSAPSGVRSDARLSFEAFEADGSPRLLVGTHRAPWSPSGSYVICTCGSTLSTVPAVREHWQAGHFDVPLYEVRL